MNYFENYLSNTCFVCIKETSQGDVSFTHTKHVLERKKNDNNIVLGVIYCYVYLLIIIRTSNTSK